MNQTLEDPHMLMLTRRSLWLGAMATAAGMASPGSASAAQTQKRPSSNDEGATGTKIRYIRPMGSGNRTGTDWRNAASLSDINAMIWAAGPDGTVYLLADEGPYRAIGPIIVSHGGALGKPVKIMGIDSGGARAKARIVGTRTSPYPATRQAFSAMNHGRDVFRLRAGADHLHFSFLEFQNIGNGAFLVQMNIEDLTLEDIVATNVTRFFERNSTAGTVTGLAARRISVLGYSKSAFRLDNNTSNVVMEDVLGDSMRQDFDNFAEGIDLSGSVHDVVFRRCTMRNSQQTRGPDDFWNGDGFTSELDTHDIVFEDCVASGNTDAGFDLKSNNVHLLRCRSYDNSSNFKFWGKQNVVMQDCISDEPSRRGGTQGAVHVTAQWGADILVRNCRFIDENRDAIVYHTEANSKAKPPIGSTITVTGSKVDTLGRLSFVDVNSTISIDGIVQSVDRHTPP